MSLFGGDNDESTDNETDEQNEASNTEAKDPEPVTKTGKYTEHTARVSFVDGNTKTVTFDAVSENDNMVYFKNHTDYNVSKSVGFAGGEYVTGEFSKETFLSVAIENVKYIETTERRQRKMETEYIPDS